MIENIVISKVGSESSDRKTFTTTHQWNKTGANLIVYLNNIIKEKGSDYNIIDENTLEFSSALKNSDEVKFVITNFEDPSGHRSLDDRMYELDRLNKKAEGKAQTSIEKRPDEEAFVSQNIITASQIWIDEISSRPSQAEEDGVAKKQVDVRLYEDVTVPQHKGWYASKSESLEDRILDWIDPRFGKYYSIRLFDGKMTEIPSSDPIGWKWDYYAGYLTIQNPDHNYSFPFYVTGYKYVGEKALDQLATWKEPVFSTQFLPLYHNDDGDIRLVLTENVFYRFDAIAKMWRPLNYGSDTLKNPVTKETNLPESNNERGDLRLVLESNDLYVWDDTFGENGEWVLLTGQSFSPENYYTKDKLDGFLSGKAAAAHEHDSLYYRQTEVDSFIRWRPSRASYQDLPPYTENQDGDVILTRDTNTIYRWVAEDPNVGQGHWTAIVESNFTWKGPVDVKGNLPLGSNNPGDVRLVRGEEKPYWWDGAVWKELKSTVEEHTHDIYIRQDDFFWKPPIDSIDNFPPLDNQDGDVRLELDTNYIYRWDAHNYKWTLISQESSWKDPIQNLSSLPLNDNKENDLIFVKETSKIYYWDSTSQIWNPIENKDHDHDDLYYKKESINALFDPQTGHAHDGVYSKAIDYNDLLNIPHFHWGIPVLSKINLPAQGEQPGDARIVLDDRALYIWTGTEWFLVATGKFQSDHDHDDQYYEKEEIDSIISAQASSLTAQIAGKANQVHNHDDLYYQKSYIDSRFNTSSGHNHDGSNSRKISYYDLDNIPDLTDHEHHDLYYSKDQLRNPGQSSVHWENIVDMPGLTSNWKSPVQTVGDLPLNNNVEGDIRIVLDDKQLYEWDSSQWNYVGDWEVATTSHWKDPVQLKTDLPLTNNVEGDVRLVLNTNMFYRWNSVSEEWVAIKTSVSSGAGGVSLEDSLVMVYVNGVQLKEGDEWEVKDSSSIELHVDTEEQDKVAIVVYDENSKFYRRFDFTSFDLQQDFTIGTEQTFRQEAILVEEQTTVQLASPHSPGSGDMLLWWNGLLQVVNEDYFETSSTTVELIEPAEEGDILIILMFDAAGTNALYTREEHKPIEGQRIFELEYPYQTGKNHLLLYYNGQLQKVGDDYMEVDSQTVEMIDPCHLGEKLTFMAFNASLSVGETDIKSACDLKIGTPPDGTWNDGLFSWSADTVACKAFDDINEALVGIVTNKPSTINETELISVEERFSGKISDGNENTEDGVGIEKDYLTNDGEFNLHTANNSLMGADQGVLRLYINDVLVDTFNLKSAFVEAYRSYDGGQQPGKYGIQDQGALEDVGQPSDDGLRDSENGLLTIDFISKYEQYTEWQYGKVRINVVPDVLQSGYNEIYLVHQIVDIVNQTQTYKFFYDDSMNQPIASDVDVTENTIMSSQYLSGVRYYSINDNFNISFTVSNLFDNTYIESPLEINFPSVDDISLDVVDLGVATPPAIGEIAGYDSNLILNKYNVYTINAQLTVTVKNPFNEYEFYSTSKNILINTYPDWSTSKEENFYDEGYRLPIGDYDNIPSSIIDNWNSQNALTAQDALLFDGQLQYANLNFSDYLPQQVVDYSTYSDEQYYVRAFKDSIPHNNGRIYLEGINKNLLLSKKIIIDVKLPSQTGWLSLNEKYDPASFEGEDGDGCLVDVEGEFFHYTSGIYSTVYSGKMIIMRIKLMSDSPTIKTIKVWSE